MRYVIFVLSIVISYNSTMNVGKRTEIPNTVLGRELLEKVETPVSIIIPAYNSGHRIRQVLTNIRGQPMPENLEVEVLVDANACRDDTAEQAAKGLMLIEHERGWRTKLIVDSRGGEPQALNKMVEARTLNGLVVGLNDDVFPTRGCLQTLCAAMLQEDKLGAIGVRPRPIPVWESQRHGTFAGRLAGSMSELYEEGLWSIVGRFYAFRPEIIGPFPNLMSEDSYMTYQALMRSKGFGILTDPENCVYFRVPTTMSDTIKNHVTHGRATTQLIQAFPDYADVMKKSRPVEEPGRKGNKISRMVQLLANENVSLDVRFSIFALLIFNKAYTILDSKIGSYDGSSRERIRSAV